MAISLNYQHLYDFTREWNFSFTDEGEVLINENFEYKQKGSLSAIGIAYGIEVAPRLYLRFTLNIWDDELSKNEWEQKIAERGFQSFAGNSSSFEAHRTDQYSFSGFNANLGMMWRSQNDRLTIGAVFKTPFKADLKHEYSSVLIQSGERANIISSVENETMEMPMSYGIGFAYRFSDAFTTSLDIYRTEWDDFIVTDSKGEQNIAHYRRACQRIGY